jgi:sec-independent protein translocase protein TatB
MFDLGWSEMMLVGVVALIVVGPKELPTLFKGVGQAMGKARGMAREFSRAMEAAADESGVKEIDRQIRAATRPVQFATAPLVLKDTSPGPATAAFSAERTEDQARVRAEAAQRALERAQRDAESALKALRDAQRPREEAVASAPSSDTRAGSAT